MINALNENLKHFQEQLIRETADYHYRFARYHLPYSLAAIYIAETDVDPAILKRNLRASDRLIRLKNNLCTIIFDGTNEAQGLKAAENLLASVQNLCFNKHLYVAISTVDVEHTEFQTVHDLFDLLSYALNHNMDNCVMESSQIINND